MKWVPVSRDEDKEDKPEEEKPKKEKPEKGQKGDKGGGKSKESSKGDPKGKGEDKGKSKADGKGKADGKDKADSKGKADGKGKADKGGKGDDGWGGKKGWKGDDKGTSKGEDAPRSKEDKGRGKDKGKDKSKDKDKDKDKDKGKDKGKSKGKGKGPEPASGGMKTVQEIESELAKATARRGGKGEGDIRRPRGGDALSKQPVHGKGSHCEVTKHSGMGCAVVSMESAAARESVMVYCEGKSAGSDQVKTEIGGVSVQLRRHQDKNVQQDVVTDIFCAWGHRAEKESPLEVDDIAEAFDKLLADAQAHGAAQTAATLSTSPQQLAGVRAPPPPPMHHPTLAGLPPGATPAQLQQAQAQYAQYRAQLYAQQQYAAYQQQLYAQQVYHYQQQQLLQQQQLQQLRAGQQPAPATAPAAAPQAAPPAAAPADAAPAPQTEPGAAEASPAAPAADGAGQVAVGTLSAAAAPPPPAAKEEVPTFQVAKPRLLPIVDPNSGKTIDTLGMNFEPRKPSSPLKIVDPTSGEAVDTPGK